MTTITLYWSNICVLHRWEKAHLDQITTQLASQGIDLLIRYFGIGYPVRMTEALSQPNAELPDLIISTDLEVFEDSRIFDKFKENLHDLKAMFPIKQELSEQTFNAWPNLLPFLVIPLVVCSNANYQEKSPLSYSEIISTDHVAFGGIGNSAARSVLKALWDMYGKEDVEFFARRAHITQMPVEAFHAIRQDKVKIGIVPSIYAQTANGKTLLRHYPVEGAIALPSYIAAHKKAPVEAIQQVLKMLLSREFCDYFVREGSLYCALENSAENPWIAKHNNRFIYPSAQWFSEVSAEQFQASYHSFMLHHANDA